MEMPNRLEVLWCRTFQSVLKIGNYFMGYRMPELLEGPGKIRELGAFLQAKGIYDVLVVTGSGMVRRGQVQPMLDGFDANGIRYTVQTYDTTDSTSDDVERGYKTYKEHGCKSIVALGGGSRIDCAKGIAAKAVHPKKTVATVITDSRTHRKAAIMDPFLTPKYAVLDPELTVGLPPHTTATTGMDALQVFFSVPEPYPSVLRPEGGLMTRFLLFQVRFGCVPAQLQCDYRSAVLRRIKQKPTYDRNHRSVQLFYEHPPNQPRDFYDYYSVSVLERMLRMMAARSMAVTATTAPIPVRIPAFYPTIVKKAVPERHAALLSIYNYEKLWYKETNDIYHKSFH